MEIRLQNPNVQETTSQNPKTEYHYPAYPALPETLYNYMNVNRQSMHEALDSTDMSTETSSFQVVKMKCSALNNQPRTPPNHKSHSNDNITHNFSLFIDIMMQRLRPGASYRLIFLTNAVLFS
jgi:hypothetical protein